MKTKDKIIELLKKLSVNKNFKETDTLRGQLGFDSLRMVTLLIELEEVMGAELREEDMDPVRIATVADVIALAEGYMGE